MEAFLVTRGRAYFIEMYMYVQKVLVASDGWRQNNDVIAYVHPDFSRCHPVYLNFGTTIVASTFQQCSTDSIQQIRNNSGTVKI
jgi:hypothetical protein